MSALRRSVRIAVRVGRGGKRALRSAARLGRRAALAARGVPRHDVRVFYGFPRVPGPRTREATGGLVKIQRMQARFPNAPWRFNVVYLVSSRLPPDADAIIAMARRYGIPLVLNQNGVAYPGWHGPGWEMTNAPIRRALAAAAHVFYQSAFCKLSADRFLDPPSTAWEVLPNAVDTRAFVPAATVQTGPLTLLVGGTQDLRYKVGVALEVLAHVALVRRDVKMLVTGRLRWSGDPRACLRDVTDLAAALGVTDRVTFVGPYAQVDAPALYRRAHLLLHPKYNDPSPGLVVEALASGLPVVYSASGGLPELVGDSGVGVPAELSWERDVAPDPKAMADGVLAVAERLPELAQAARQRAVERFDIRGWLDRHADVFAALRPA